MMHQSYGDFELVSGLSFDQILDVAVVYQNLNTRQVMATSNAICISFLKFSSVLTKRFLATSKLL